ncbi:hypothetical protein AF335_06460 [Streptomyces eurocidicus]|uniref:Secreted protein n=1 Tax=Streptomyces eurocidicus TaxID=66423 RepID=A0A2N8NZS0_STREU|nr:hypothetical protein [Streptomyces eurocidicus]MBB5118774.1 hypothetical protein [Streptomyces eurocidicus]MBF6051418.1 hypothetical protein [Streptomyces eurocidicus]PNE34268.1 hypothetical protein AF335_06460 [Streptomyces eurocidicus]
MRTAPWLTAAVTAAACGSLVLGAAGPAPAGTPARPGTRAAAAQRNGAPDALAEIRALVSRITGEARSGSPDAAALASLRQRLDASAERLLDDVATARPKAAPTAPDPVTEVRRLLDKLLKDISKIIDDVAGKDTPSAAADAGVADATLQDVLTKVPAW